MTPGTLVLLHSPFASAAAWGSLPDLLRSSGKKVLVPQIEGGDRPPYAGRYVAQAALQIAECAPAHPLVLVAHGAAGPLLPAIAAAQRAAHRRVAGYLFIDAELPAAGAQDWPDAPCGYLHTSSEHDREARQARLRDWPVVARGPGDPGAEGTAEAVRELIAVM
ncbi:MAG: hypothetical protein JWO67_3571 [Streptosporangiaceae bacterium]|jgi:hypothetical protein|nr:hypothetical protein [Streptosporangiaceae bacterium]